MGIAVAPFVAIHNESDFNNVEGGITFPAILKLANFGYDGKGQVTCHNLDDVKQAFADLNQAECVLEQRINLEREVSTVLARSQLGDITNFPIAENVHVNGILHSTTVPSVINQVQTQTVMEMADKIAEGRVKKWFKEATLLHQPFIKDNKMSIDQYLKSQNNDLTVTEFKRIQLG